jgi:hypothetical protein
MVDSSDSPNLWDVHKLMRQPDPKTQAVQTTPAEPKALAVAWVQDQSAIVLHLQLDCAKLRYLISKRQNLIGTAHEGVVSCDSHLPHWYVYAWLRCIPLLDVLRRKPSVPRAAMSISTFTALTMAS